MTPLAAGKIHFESLVMVRYSWSDTVTRVSSALTVTATKQLAGCLIVSRPIGNSRGRWIVYDVAAFGAGFRTARATRAARGPRERLRPATHEDRLGGRAGNRPAD